VALFYEIGKDLANSQRWPEWRKESEFSAVRAESKRDRP
jgi:hypothetical protein